VSAYGNASARADALHEHGCVQHASSTTWIFHLDGRSWAGYVNGGLFCTRGSDGSSPSFASADEAIHSLIGAPQ
jgi:hypothetical protein